MLNSNYATMVKTKKRLTYYCQDCGTKHSKWSGRCEHCGTWDSIVEEAEGAAQHMGSRANHAGNKIEFVDLLGPVTEQPRTTTAIKELDRVLGGGLVKGSAILLGGDPGIGKSTLLLQLVSTLSQQGCSCVYISGEESVDQVRLRAKRMGVSGDTVKLASATLVNDISTTLDTPNAPDLVIIDSIQTMFLEEIGSAPGTVSQVRSSAHELIRIAKSRGTSMVLVGHVTKEGQIAGPKLLEHMVDTVLYFEGERGHNFRILRAVKNRFGAANEIGVFEMKDKGLEEVPNPSSLFLSERQGGVSGSAVFAGLEGTRPVLVEVQALVSPSLMANPRRAVVGWDSNRLAMLLAVLQTRYGISFGDKEVYLNMAGGLRIAEPAADLAVATALLSAVTDIAVPEEHVVFGEIGLSGEIRMVGQADIRLKEAEKLGFKGAIVPSSVDISGKLGVKKVRHVKELNHFFPRR